MDDITFLRGKLYPSAFNPCTVCGFIMGHRWDCPTQAESPVLHIEFVCNLTDEDFEFLASMRVIV